MGQRDRAQGWKRRRGKISKRRRKKWRRHRRDSGDSARNSEARWNWQTVGSQHQPRPKLRAVRIFTQVGKIYMGRRGPPDTSLLEVQVETVRCYRDQAKLECPKRKTLRKQLKKYSPDPSCPTISCWPSHWPDQTGSQRIRELMLFLEHRSIEDDSGKQRLSTTISLFYEFDWSMQFCAVTG